MNINKETRQFIDTHREDAVGQLALLGRQHPLVDLPFALEQIQGWQTARKKLPAWAACQQIIYPPHISMEQCSSEVTARYKAALLSRWLSDQPAGGSLSGTQKPSAHCTLYDFTGGFGVDFSYMAQGFDHAVYVEQQSRLCDIARHNFSVLGLEAAEVVCGDGTAHLHALPSRYPAAVAVDREGADGDARQQRVVFYLDPARRDQQGKKVFGMRDCQPDVLSLRDALMQKSDAVLLKLSPMFDWHAAVAEMSPDGKGTGCEVHIVSVANDCKELLLLLTHSSSPLRVVCVNDDQVFSYMPLSAPAPASNASQPTVDAFLHWGLEESAPQERWFLYVPNASVMKAGAFYLLAYRYAVAMVDRQSHLFISQHAIADFPGRTFKVTALSTMNKRDLKDKLGTLDQANIAVRNFPMRVEELRKRLKLKDGGSVYLFATTVSHRHLIILAEK